MSDIQNEIESKAEEVKDNSADQHLGDAMDDADLQADGAMTDDGELEADGARQKADRDNQEEAEPYSFPPR